MLQERVEDCAILLYRLFNTMNVKFGLFGDFALSTLIGKDDRPRGGDTIQCIASASKDRVIELLDCVDGFAAMPGTNEEFVTLFWSDPRESEVARANRTVVAVEIFCEKVGEHAHPSPIKSTNYTIYGTKMFSRHWNLSSFMDPIYLFKDKIRLAATRDIFKDSADLRQLEAEYGDFLRQQEECLDMAYVGLAIKRYPELDRLFERLGVDVEAALLASESLDLTSILPPTPTEVRRHLLPPGYK